MIAERIGIEVRNIAQDVAALICLAVVTDACEESLPVRNIVVHAEQVEIGRVVETRLAQKIIGGRDRIAGQCRVGKKLQKVLRNRSPPARRAPLARGPRPAAADTRLLVGWERY